MSKQYRSLVATLEGISTRARVNAGHLTLESIAFQYNDPLGPQLEEIFQQYKDLVDAGAKSKVIASQKELKKELERVVYDRLGITVSLITDSNLAATMPNVFVPHNPVIQDRWRSFYQDYPGSAMKDLEKLSSNDSLGTVNTETAKVSGWFSKQKCPLFLNMVMLFKEFKMTAAEVTAICLHELGHDFQAVIFSSNINTTNRIIADIAKHITSSDRGGDVNYVYVNLKKIDPKATKDLAEALLSKNKVVLSVATYRLMRLSAASLMSDSVYDRTNFESLSDQFAARFGYGKAFMTGMEKLEEDYSEYKMLEVNYQDSLAAMLYLSFLGLAFTIGSIFAPVVGLKIYMLVIGALSAWVAGLIYGANSESGMDRTYDNIRDRYLRIRLQHVEMIKNPDLPVETKTVLLEEIKTMDAIISQKKVFDNPIAKFALKFSSKDRSVTESIKMQRELEEMIANDIFVAAQQLQLKD